MAIQKAAISKLANSKEVNFASTFCVVLLEKRPVKILASFLVDSIAREHLAFLALTPPEFFTFPGGGVQTPPGFFTFPGGGAWGVLILGGIQEKMRWR